jgi:hypothetical protein
MTDIRTLGEALQRANNRIEARQYIRAVVGTPDGTTLEGDRPGYIWAQIKTADSVSVIQIRCDKVLPQMGMAVICRKNRYDGVLEVVEGAPDTMNEYFNGLGSANTGTHAWAHGLYGPDVDWIESGRFLPLLIHPTDPPSLSVVVREFYYVYDGARVCHAEEEVDLTSYVPSNTGEQRLVILDFVPSTGAIAITAADPIYSTIVPSTGHPFVAADIEAISLVAGRSPVMAWRLYASQTEINWIDYVKDQRLHYAVSLDAANITFTPAVLTDWDSDADPGDMDDAIDQLAERVDDLEAGGSGGVSVAEIADQKSAGTYGGTSTAGSWQTRDINTEVSDADGIVTISSNRFTPVAGTYRIVARSKARNIGQNMLRLYNYTQSSVVKTGDSEYFLSASGTAWLSAVFTADGTDEYEIQHKCSSTQAVYGFGYTSNQATETFTTVQLLKIG